MYFKYFLDMDSEDDVINSSALTKFRKLRLKKSDLLDLLINKTVEIAIEKKIIKSNEVISIYPSVNSNINTLTEIIENIPKY